MDRLLIPPHSTVTYAESGFSYTKVQVQILEMVATGEPLSRVLDALVGMIEDQRPDTIASILLLDEQGKLWHGAARRLPAPYMLAIDGTACGEGIGSCGEAAFTGQRVIARDILTHPNWVAYKDLALSHGLRACWSEPIIARDGVILGTFALYYTQPRTPDPGELRLLDFAAALARIAIEHSQAEEDQLLRETRLSRLHDITAQVDLPFAEKVRELLALGCGEFRLEGGILSEVIAGKYHALHVYPEGFLPPDFSCDLGDTFCEETLRRGEAFSFAYLGEARWGCLPDHKVFGPEAYLGTPVHVDGRLFGTLCFTSEKARREPFTAADAEFLRLIAQWAGAELARLRHQEALRHITSSARCLLWCAEVTDLGEPDLTWRFDHFDEEAAQRFLEIDNPEGLSYPEAAHRRRHPEDRAHTDRYGQEKVRRGQSYSQEYRCQGADGLWHWIQEDVHVETLGTKRWRVVGTGTNITERKEAEAATIQAGERDRRISEMLQASLLPPLAASAAPGFEVCAACVPLLNDEALVGGDFYDVFALPEGRTAFVVGDVMGKGLTAALSIAEVRFTLRGFLRDDFARFGGDGTDPALALAHLNRLLLTARRLEDRPRNALVSVSLAVADSITGEVWLSAAGAEAALVLCAATGKASSVDASDLILGASEEATYRTLKLQLDPGDALLFVTDGLTEARGEIPHVIGKRSGGDSRPGCFGIEGLCAAMQIAAALNPGTGNLDMIGQSVIEQARTFAGGHFRDDVCLLALRRDEMINPRILG